MNVQASGVEPVGGTPDVCSVADVDLVAVIVAGAFLLPSGSRGGRSFVGHA